MYDSKGRETVSSGPWTDLELGTDPDSATYDFRRILKGVEYTPKKLNPLRRTLNMMSPVRRGVITMEITTAVFLLQMMLIMNFLKDLQD